MIVINGLPISPSIRFCICCLCSIRLYWSSADLLVTSPSLSCKFSILKIVVQNISTTVIFLLNAMKLIFWRILMMEYLFAVLSIKSCLSDLSSQKLPIKSSLDPLMFLTDWVLKDFDFNIGSAVPRYPSTELMEYIRNFIKIRIFLSFRIIKSKSRCLNCIVMHCQA